MKPKTVLVSCALVATVVSGSVSTAFAQDGKYRLSGSARYSKVPADARIARLKAVNDRFNQNYGKAVPKPKTPAIRINEANNRVKPFVKNTPAGGIKGTASATRPNTLANGSGSRLGNNRPGTTAGTASKARPNSLGSKGMTTARTASKAKPIASASKGASAYRNVQTARSARQAAQGTKTARQVAQSARTAKTVVGGAKAARLALGATGVGVAGLVATELVLQEIEDPGKTGRDINGTVNDIKTGQFLPKAGQKVNRTVSDAGKALDKAGKDIGNFVNGIFR